MGELSKSIKKDEVYYFTGEVKKLLELLNGTIIYCDDKGRISLIESQVDKIESLIYNYEPSIYEECSMKVKNAYINMINAKKEYDSVVSNKCFKEVIEEYRIAYENKVKEYEILKEYRSKLKAILIEN